jgi:GH25 family lysozyme M1 (1,4-beta-N-acetylmuramidase)
MLPLALDIEPDPYTARQKTNECYGLSQAAMVTWIRQFLAEAQIKVGKRPVIYALTACGKACTGNSAAFGSHPLWTASSGKSDPMCRPAGAGTRSGSTQAEVPSPKSRVPPQTRITSLGPPRLA